MEELYRRLGPVEFVNQVANLLAAKRQEVADICNRAQGGLDTDGGAFVDSGDVGDACDALYHLLPDDMTDDEEEEACQTE